MKNRQTKNENVIIYFDKLATKLFIDKTKTITAQ